MPRLRHWLQASPPSTAPPTPWWPTAAKPSQAAGRWAWRTFPAAGMFAGHLHLLATSQSIWHSSLCTPGRCRGNCLVSMVVVQQTQITLQLAPCCGEHDVWLRAVL
jgi:hypothetical protein